MLGKEQAKIPIRRHQSPRGPVVDHTQYRGRRSAPSPSAPHPPRRWRLSRGGSRPVGVPGRRHCRRHPRSPVSGELVNTHNPIITDTLNLTGMLRNHRLAHALSDAGWSEFAQMLPYKQPWRTGQLVEADQWFPSTRPRPECGDIDTSMTSADRVFTYEVPAYHRHRRQHHAESDPLGTQPPAQHLNRSPDPQATGPGHQCPPTGRRWPTPPCW